MPSYTQYKRQMAVLDADDSEIESWITVRGNHIPIMKGQSKGDAVKSFIEKKKHNLVENHNALIEATKLEEKGYFGKATPSHSKAITKSAFKMGDEEKNLEELMQFGEKEANTAPTRKHYDPDFETVRKNAKANHYLYGGKYTQRSKQAAYKEWKHDTSSEENLRAANKWVNSELVAKKEYNPDYETLKKELADVGGEGNLGLLGAAEKERRGLTQEYNRLFEESKRLKSAIKSEVDLVKRNELKTQLKEIENKMENNNSESRNITEKAVSVWNEGKKKESKPSDSSKGGSTSQPKDIHDWKFEDVMKLKSSDPRVHKYIAENFGVSKATVAILGEVLPTEDLYFKVHDLTNMYGEGWDRTSGGKRLRDMERDAAGIAKLVSENPDKFGYDY